MANPIQVRIGSYEAVSFSQIMLRRSTNFQMAKHAFAMRNICRKLLI